LHRKRIYQSFKFICPWAFLGLVIALFSSCTTLSIVTEILSGRDRDREIALQPVHWQERGPLRYTSGRIENPPLSFWVVAIDLDSPGLQVVVGPEPLEYGIVPSIRVSTFAKRYGCFAAINANPFDRVSNREGEPTRVIGIAFHEGQILSNPIPRYWALLIFKDGTARIVPQNSLLLPDRTPDYQFLDSVRYAVGGFFPVLRDGIPLAGRGTRYPRSAVGVSQDGKILYLLAINGRLLDSIGTTEHETGQLLSILGAWEGILLDGGGSTSLVIQQTDGTYKILNHPVQEMELNFERAVATCIGFRITGAW